MGSVSSQGKQREMLPGGNTRGFSAQGQPGDLVPGRSQPTSWNHSGVKPWANTSFEDSGRFVAPWRRVPTPFWLLGAKRADSAQTPLIAVYSRKDPVLPRVETTNFPKSSLSAAQHSTRARDPVNHNSPETSQRQPQPSAKSKFRTSPACRTQASAH